MVQTAMGYIEPVIEIQKLILFVPGAIFYCVFCKRNFLLSYATGKPQNKYIFNCTSM